MKITLDHITKRYNREIIFRDVCYELSSGKSYAITGPNGSGKSTLLQVISGYVRPSAGRLLYNDLSIEEAYIFKHLAIVTPYLELIEEFTLSELFDFHFKFKKSTLSKDEFLQKCYLKDAINKQVKNFSSGMKQRLKLALALFSKVEILLLDEPTTNMDQQGIEWYKNQIGEMKDRLVVVASNQTFEYDFCSHTINIEQFKERVT